MRARIDIKSSDVIPTGDGTIEMDNKVKKNAESSSSENRILTSRGNVMVVAQGWTKRRNERLQICWK